LKLSQYLFIWASPEADTFPPPSTIYLHEHVTVAELGEIFGTFYELENTGIKAPMNLYYFQGNLNELNRGSEPVPLLDKD
jgi:hypothetical protein